MSKHYDYPPGFGLTLSLLIGALIWLLLLITAYLLWTWLT